MSFAHSAVVWKKVTKGTNHMLLLAVAAAVVAADRAADGVVCVSCVFVIWQEFPTNQIVLETEFPVR